MAGFEVSINGRFWVSTEAEERIATIAREYHERIVARWKGYEQVLLLEIVRALDETAFAFALASNRAQLVQKDAARHAMLLGGAHALGPLLREVRGTPGGVPWPPTNPRFAAMVDDHLMHCGHLAHLLRMAALERYGLSNSTFIRPDHLVLEVAQGDAEEHDVAALRHLAGLVLGAHAGLEGALLELSPTVFERLDSYVEIDREHFIRYDNDAELVAYYRTLASIRTASFFEGEALPEDVRIGGRSFGDWCAAAVAASGRVLQHAAFASRLQARHPHLAFRNLLTICARKGDVAAVLLQAGEDPEHVAPFLAAATLEDSTAEAYAADHEVPVPFYIDFGRDFLLLPCFGGLLNPLAALVRFLKSNYRSDWDRAVARREEIFRSDLREVFRAPRFCVSDTGARLRRGDRTELTDVDAMVVDRECGTLGLFQLKWHDIYGRSLKERHSRRLNLLRANEWVDRVAGWIDGRSAADVATDLQLGAASAGRAPNLFVVSRYAAQFTHNDPYDPRAAWLGWADVVNRVQTAGNDDVLAMLAREFQGGLRRASGERESSVQQFHLPGLTVDVRATVAS